jgi:hypothetical protein
VCCFFNCESLMQVYYLFLWFIGTFSAVYVYVVVNDELERMWKIMSQDFPHGTEENHCNLIQGSEHISVMTCIRKLSFIINGGHCTFKCAITSSLNILSSLQYISFDINICS